MPETDPLHTLPSPRHAFDVVMHDGAVIRIRQHGNPDGPRLVMSHGNGLAIDGYAPFWAPLRDRYEVVLFDLRNHGNNPLHTRESHTMPNFISDMETVWHAIERELGAKPAAGVFHSLSGVVAALHALEHGPRFKVLVLFDPPFYPRDGHPLRGSQHEDKTALAARALRRPERYADPSDLARQFARRQTRWVPEAYELVARATLRYDPDACDWVLACPREWEAHVFSRNADPNLWPRMAHCPVPVKLICGDPEIDGAMPPALIGRAMAAELPLAYEAIPGTTHFLQIERPAECARAMESFLAAHGLAA
ncbi:MAG TPA: alpha/beta hydrolase [Candidatus Binataceae bacterium]